MVPNILGGEEGQIPDVGTMLSTADGRILRTKLDISVGQQKTTLLTCNTREIILGGPDSPLVRMSRLV
jgi:hypothetical protein